MADMLNPEDMLKLVADTELELFAQSLGCSLTPPISRDNIKGIIQDCSRTKVISALIAINGVWLTMMRDIVEFLESHNISMRTTGCVIALPISGQEVELYLSPQVADFIAHFDKASVSKRTIADWNDALAKWKSLQVWIQQTVAKGIPYQDKELSFDRIKSIHLMNAGHVLPGDPSDLDPYEDRISVNPQTAEEMFRVWRTLDYLNAKLKDLENLPHLPPATKSLMQNLARQAASITRGIKGMRQNSKLWREIGRHVKQTEPWSEAWTTEKLFHKSSQWGRGWDKWVRFIEDVLALASLEKSSEVLDLLRLDLLKDRPRLFEVWCMSQILSMYRSWGCRVELESIQSGDPPIWALNFSRASKPVARIEHEGAQWWFFYQLFKTGVTQANMPDFALLKGRSVNSGVLWIADPKYSEAGAYSHKKYVEVAERYQDAFRPQRTLICEFFPRREWFGGDCHESGDRISILSEVQPESEGLRILQRELRKLHTFPTEYVLAVDCSESFIDKLPTFGMGLQQLVAQAAVIICFAGEAKELSPAASIDFTAVQIEAGTCLKPLVTALEAVSERNLSQTPLILVTDGQFSDATDDMRTNLNNLFIKVEQVEDESSLNRIIAKYIVM